MASTHAIFMSTPSTVNYNRIPTGARFKPAAALSTASNANGHQRSKHCHALVMKENMILLANAAGMVAALAVPEVADAAERELSPSLKNFLLSIGAGGIVLLVIVGAVVAVSNFDPVKRR